VFRAFQKGVPVGEHDLGHRHKRGAASENLGTPVGVELGELEVSFKVLAQGHGLGCAGLWSVSSHYMGADENFVLVGYPLGAYRVHHSDL